MPRWIPKPTVRLKRLLLLPAIVVMQTCLGGVYAWSAMAPPLQASFGFSAGQTQLIFGLTIATFTGVMVYAGRLLGTHGPRRLALLGGLLFGAGHLMAAASQGRFLWLMAGFSLLGGTGIGLCYVSALTTGVQWFPRHKGLVTGVAVAGFGAGAVLLSALITGLLAAGWTVLQVIGAIGWGYGVIICLAAICLFQHNNSCAAAASDITIWRDPLFRGLATGMFCGTFAGLLIIGNLKPIGLDNGLSQATATAAIGFFAVGNAIGRISWGWLADRLGYASIVISLLFLAVSLMLLTSISFTAGAFLVGLGFGACFVVYATQVAAHYGPAHIAEIYPLIFLAYGAAGITGPTLGGLLYDLTQTYTWAITLGTAVALIGTWQTWRVRTNRG
ncbi:MAG: MFS transporter [Kiritimatiellia bacterium]|nr:MFS transporter [Lentisphaerota bacterium]